MDLYLPVKGRWFLDIQNGIKPFEYRLYNDYWCRRLIGKTFDRIVITHGYPKRDDMSRRIIKPWADYEIQTVVSEEWDNIPQTCFAIRISQ